MIQSISFTLRSDKNGLVAASAAPQQPIGTKSKVARIVQTDRIAVNNFLEADIGIKTLAIPT